MVAAHPAPRAQIKALRGNSYGLMELSDALRPPPGPAKAKPQLSAEQRQRVEQKRLPALERRRKRQQQEAWGAADVPAVSEGELRIKTQDCVPKLVLLCGYYATLAVRFMCRSGSSSLGG